MKIIVASQLRVLIVGPSGGDVAQVRRILERGGYALTWRRVDDIDDLPVDKGGSWGTAIASLGIPNLFRLWRPNRLSPPIIGLLGTANSEMASATLHARAYGCAANNNPSSILSSTARALRDARHHRSCGKRESTQRLQIAALEATTNGIVITDINGNIEWVNPAFTFMTGYTSKEAIGKNPRFLNAQTQPSVFYKNLWRTILAGSTWHGELSNRCKDGTLYKEEQTITPVLDDTGKISHFIAIKQDVTARCRAEEELRSSEEKYRAMFDFASDSLFVIDSSNLKILDANKNALSKLGYTKAELARMTCHDIFVPTAASPGEEIFQTLHDQKEIFLEGTHRRKDGSHFPVEITAQEIEYGGHRVFQCFCRDITDRQRTERALRESEQRFRQLAENIRSVFWISSTDRRQILYVSPAYEELWGRSRKSLYEQPQSWLEAVFPQDRQRVVDMMKINAAGDLFEMQSLTYRIVQPNGAVRWILSRIYPIRDDDGVVVRLAGIADDITDQKTAEDHRLNQERAKRDLMIQEVHHGIQNNLQGIAGLLERHADIHPDARPPLQKAMTEVMSISAAHSIQKDAAHGDSNLYTLINVIARFIEEMYNGNILLARDVEGAIDVQLTECEAVPIALVLNELILNAIVHGVRDEDDITQVKVAINTNGVGVNVLVENRVAGRVRGFDLEAQNRLDGGLKMARSLLPLHGASLTLRNDAYTFKARLVLSAPVVVVN